MSTKALQALIEWAERGDVPDDARGAREELAAIRKAAVALVDWNNKGRAGFHLDAARGFGVLEAIARESAK